MTIEIQPKKVAVYLSFIAIGFVIAHIVAQVVKIVSGQTYGLEIFNLEGEKSIPRFYSSVLLLLCSVILFMISESRQRNASFRFYWIGLAVFFLFLAIDKNSAVHEGLARQLRVALNISKIQFYAWVYGIAVIAFPAVYMKFTLSLPRKTMVLFFVAAIVYIIGAFGIDLIVAYLGKSLDHQNVVYLALATLEEAVEMGGIILFLYTLLLYLTSEVDVNHLALTR